MNRHFTNMRNGGRYQADKERREAEKRAELAAKEKLTMNDINFPTLGGGWSAAAPAQTDGLNYASLAADWEKRDNIEHAKQMRREEQQRKHDYELAQIRARRAAMSGTFEYMEEEEQVDEPPPPQPSQVDEWSTVQYKKPKKKLGWEFQPEVTVDERQEDSDWDDEEPDYRHPKEKGSIW